MHSRLLGAAAALALLTTGAAQAETVRFSAMLFGKSEVPPNDSRGSGVLRARLDTSTRTFTYRVSYSGLTGPAVAAHFHGPAAPGMNAPPIVTVMNLASPIVGQATLTDAQIADLRAGRWYFNIHTQAHPGGEIRGQLEETR